MKSLSVYEPIIIVDEVRSGIDYLKKGKSTSYDDISEEELMATGELGIKTIHKPCSKIWDSGEIPKDWEGRWTWWKDHILEKEQIGLF